MIPYEEDVKRLHSQRITPPPDIQFIHFPIEDTTLPLLFVTSITSSRSLSTCLLYSYRLVLLSPYPSHTSLFCSLSYVLTDGDIAEDSDVSSLIDDIIIRIQNGHKIFIHCFGGTPSFFSFLFFSSFYFLFFYISLFLKYKLLVYMTNRLFPGRGRTYTVATVLLGIIFLFYFFLSSFFPFSSYIL